jgi:hypothetical protein
MSTNKSEKSALDRKIKALKIKIEINVTTDPAQIQIDYGK